MPGWCIWLSCLIFSSPVLKDKPISKDQKEVAFIIAMLFVSHPLATQSVTYIIQRMSLDGSHVLFAFHRVVCHGPLHH
jgi:hypothetical protein